MKNIKDTIEKINGNYPEKILQFGEGNFLRAFSDWMIDNANNNGDYKGSIVVCQPVSQGLTDLINNQNGIYTLVMRGLENGSPIENIQKITSISRCINPYEDYEALLSVARSDTLEVVISNTTEAGISYCASDRLSDAPPSSFPAKLTALLYERFTFFSGDLSKGLLFLPVELIDSNGDVLKSIILRYANEWELSQEFIDWIENANKFTNTLVDRIVTGYPKNQIEYFNNLFGYEDNIIVTSELFNLWVIEGDSEWKDILPIHKNSANVLWTNDATPYKTRKVRILNGAHTASVLAAFLHGHETVNDVMNDPIFNDYLTQLIFEEITPTIDLPADELESFANDVLVRFMNPYIQHKLLDISLNSCSKFNTRCLPSLLDYYSKYNILPERLCFAFAAFIKFYIGTNDPNSYVGTRADGINYPIRDSEDVLEYFRSISLVQDSNILAHKILSQKTFWGGKDLSEVPGLVKRIADYLERLKTEDIRTIMANINTEGV